MSELTVPSAEADALAWQNTLVGFRERFAGISITDRDAYEPRRLAVAECRKTRTAIERRRKELTEPALRFQKMVKARADGIVAEIEKIEEPLALANKLIDEEAARLKKLAEQDERDKQQAAEKASLDAHAARLKKDADDAAAKLKADHDALAADRAKMQEEQRRAAAELAEKAAAQKVIDDAKATVVAEANAKIMAENNRERVRLAEEGRKLREQQAEVAKAEKERLDKIEAARLAKEKADKAEAKRVADEAAAKAAEASRVERERVEAERRAAMLPDVDKVRAWANQIDSIIEAAPNVNSDDAFLFLNDAFNILAELATKLRSFGA